MSYNSQLATTGAGALVLGGVAIDQASLVMGALAAVVAAAALVRFGWRRGKAVNA